MRKWLRPDWRARLLDLFACFLIPLYTLLFTHDTRWFTTNLSVIAAARDQRHGFFLNDYEYYQPPMRAGQEKLPLFVMSTGAPLNRAQFERTRDELYARVYKYGAKG